MRKKTSRRLNEELSRYDINALPPELQKELAATMSRPDFDPDKLAAALKKARVEQACSQTEENPSLERCSWHETIERVLMLLGGALFLLGVFLLLAYAAVLFFDKMTGTGVKEQVQTAMQAHPATAIILLAALFFAFLSWLVIFVAKKMAQPQ